MQCHDLCMRDKKQWRYALYLISAHTSALVTENSANVFNFVMLYDAAEESGCI